MALIWDCERRARLAEKPQCTKESKQVHERCVLTWGRWESAISAPAVSYVLSHSPQTNICMRAWMHTLQTTPHTLVFHPKKSPDEIKCSCFRERHFLHSVGSVCVSLCFCDCLHLSFYLTSILPADFCASGLVFCPFSAVMYSCCCFHLSQTPTTSALLFVVFLNTFC